MPRGNYVHLDVEEILKISEKAMLLLLEDGEEAWVPLSQIANAEDYTAGDKKATVSVTEWIAKQKGWL